MNYPSADTVTVFLFRLYFLGMEQRIQKIPFLNHFQKYVQHLNLSFSEAFPILISALLIRLQLLQFPNKREKPMSTSSRPNPPQNPENVIKSASTYTIYLSPLPIDITKNDLTYLFSLCGQVLEVSIRFKYANGEQFAQAYVKFAESVSREKAKKFYHGKKIGSVPLKVQDSKEFSRKAYQDAQKTNTMDNLTVYGDDSREQEPAPKKRLHSDSSSPRYNYQRSNPKSYGNSNSYWTRDSYQRFPQKSRDYHESQRNSYHGTERNNNGRNQNDKKPILEPPMSPEEKQNSFEY